jgi:hypothetical protein
MRNQIVKINDELLIIKHVVNGGSEELAHEWNAINPLNKTFKKEDKMYFCESVEEATVIEDNVGTPIV